MSVNGEADKEVADGFGDASIDSDGNSNDSVTSEQTSKSLSSFGSIASYIAECQLAYSDLQISAELIENAVKDSDFDALKLELEDIEYISTKYSNAFVRILEKCSKEERPSQEAYRRKFLLLFKSAKSRALKALPKPSSSNSDTVTDAETVLKLPKLEITPFSGEKDEWNLFKGTFVTYIHENKKMKDIEKFRFLKSKLKGTPLHLIEAIPLEGKFYNSAWKIIETHFDDPMKRISRHLDALFSSSPQKRLSLRMLVTQIRAHMTSLQVILQEHPEIDVLSQFGIHAFLLRADKKTNLDWQCEIEKTKKFATFEEFINYMDGRCNAFERANGESEQAGSSGVGSGKSNASSTKSNVGSGKSNASSSSKGHALAAKEPAKKKSINCYYCTKDHTIQKCDDFAKLSAEDRLTFVNKRRLCRRCLKGKCYGACNVKCSICERFHNTLIHLDRLVNAKPASANGESLSQPINFRSSEIISEARESSIEIDSHKNLLLFDDFNSEAAGWVGISTNESVYTLLATAMIKIPIVTDQDFSVRALIDPGSQFNFISSELVSKLNLKISKNEHHIQAINDLHTVANKTVSLKVKSRVSNFSFTLKCLVLEKIIDELPNNYFSIEQWQFPKYLTLADPKFNIPAPVDLLIGGAIFWKLLKPQIRNLGNVGPRIFASHLGWLVAGEINLNADDKNIYNFSALSSEAAINLANKIERLWLIDEYKNDNNWSFEEVECERFYVETSTRHKDGSFNVFLPFKLPQDRLGLSKAVARKRFHLLERRFAKDSVLKLSYVECIQDYIKQGHLIEVDEKTDENEFAYFLPHHPVIKSSSTSTKCRAVFDASAKPYNGLSLNQCLMVGPTVQSDLFSILLRSRMYKYLFTADITQMYRQVKVDKSQQSLLRLFWRNDHSEPLKIYQHTTVPFGLACAPFLATRCLKKLADDDGDRFPLAKSVLLRDFYVDDVITGSNDIHSTLQIRDQVIDILKGGGFQLNKWCANNSDLLTGIPASNLEKSFPLYFGNEFIVKTLGIIWYPSEDVYKIWVHMKDTNVFTKRKILSIVSSIFDPLGFLGPVIVIAKLIIQSLWSKTNNSNKKLEWDDDISEDDRQVWVEFSTQLNKLDEISISRFVFTLASHNRIELHGFADASDKAYGAVVYVRSCDDAEVTMSLMCSRSRVSPLKKSTIPRLELCAAKLLAELVNSVKEALADLVQLNSVRLWSDSEIVLYWVYSHYGRWQPFVANRVKSIQDLSKDSVWDYVRSKGNPADVLSRGLQPAKLKDCEIWWNGPSWLHSNEEYGHEKIFKPSKTQPLEVRQCRKILTCTSILRKNAIFEKFSEFNKLVRITAWCVRFCFNLHFLGPLITEKCLNLWEIQQATYILIKVVQKESFKYDLKQLQNGEPLLYNSHLLALSPFLDSVGIIRVGGRLKHSELSYDHRFQIILPQNHTFTKLLVRYEHLRNFHAGPQFLKAILRRKYWILRQGNLIQNIILNCLPCQKMKADTKTQFMASLPKNRVVPGRAFQTTGVDFAGPINLLRFKGDRRRTIIHGYISVFVCFSTKAIHLELVSDLTSEAFLAALSRFIGRRGVPAEVWSDNGTNFVGAKSKLNELTKLLTEKETCISQFLGEKGCNWQFIPPHAPSFGGLWEAGVKSVKKHLKTTIGDTLFTYEQFETLLIQIEACLNSRPLIAESTDPNEPGALTPGHFLVGGPITSLPNLDLTEVPSNRLKYWELVTQKMQNFWKRWSIEYLNSLQQRTKWRKEKNEIHINDVVLVKEDNTPPTKWPLGLITELHPGDDGIVRVVTVRMRKQHRIILETELLITIDSLYPEEGTISCPRRIENGFRLISKYRL